MSLGANEAPIYHLVEYLKANIPSLNKVYLEWPNHNEPLDMPCASILTVGSPEYTSKMPTLWKYEAPLSYYFVGEYNISLQLDLWAEYKEARGELMESVFDLFDKQFQDSGKSLGISLNMSEYFDTIARYDLTGYTYNDNAEGSQRDEWRSKLTVLANFQRVITRAESTMDDIQIIPEVQADYDTVI